MGGTEEKYSKDSRCFGVVLAHAEAWRGAIRSEFLQKCKDGTLSPHSFNWWLAQDQVFVRQFRPFAAKLLARAPEEHKELLQAGLAALDDELQWFEAKKEERRLPTGVTASPSCQRYIDKLAEATQGPYHLALAFFWAVEYCYNEGWLVNSPMQPEFREYADRWGNQGFSDYVVQLGQKADETCASCSPDEWREVEAIITWTATAEIDFWADAMAHSAPPS